MEEVTRDLLSGLHVHAIYKLLDRKSRQWFVHSAAHNASFMCAIRELAHSFACLTIVNEDFRIRANTSEVIA